MWKLKIADGGPWLKSGNNHIGRETWEFDQNNGSSEERDAVDAARAEFQKNRFRTRHSSDILARMQVKKEKKNLNILILTCTLLSGPTESLKHYKKLWCDLWST
jgi:hypothetical protein